MDTYEDLVNNNIYISCQKPLFSWQPVDYSFPIVSFWYDTIVSYYKGEDSGARYPEYDSHLVATYNLTPVLNEKIGYYSIKDLYGWLCKDGAETIPVSRHKALVEFILNHPELKVE